MHYCYRRDFQIVDNNVKKPLLQFQQTQDSNQIQQIQLFNPLSAKVAKLQQDAVLLVLSCLVFQFEDIFQKTIAFENRPLCLLGKLTQGKFVTKMNIL